MTDPADDAVGSEAVTPALPPVPAAARALFADALPLAQRYAAVLATTGIAHGHLGPRELPRLWDRHLANSAVVTDLLPAGATVVDVGSGAGLPGLPMAIRRPDLQVVLLEPMLRRTGFLQGTVESLELAERVQVLRGRAEDPAVGVAVGAAQWLTARAVAPLDRLLAWCLPLLAPGGRLLALKGASAAEEVARFRGVASGRLQSAVARIEIVDLGPGYDLESTQVVVVERSARRWRAQ